MTFDPGKFGITSEMSTANLLTAVETYKGLVEKLAGFATPQSELEKAVEKRILADDKTNHAVHKLNSEVRDSVLTTLFRTPEMSVGFVEELKNLLADVKNLRDYHVSKVAKGTKVSLPVDTTTETNREAAVQIGEFISNMYKLFSSDFGKSLPGYVPEEFNKVPTKPGKNETLLYLPRVPGTRKDSGAIVGRGAVHKIARYSITNGDQVINVPAGTHLKDVLVSYCSTPQTGVVTVSKLQELLKATKQEIAAKPGHTWSYKFRNGIILESRVPTDADLSDDDSEEDDDEE